MRKLRESLSNLLTARHRAFLHLANVSLGTAHKIRPHSVLKVSLRILTQEGDAGKWCEKVSRFSEPPSASNGLCEQRKPLRTILKRRLLEWFKWKKRWQSREVSRWIWEIFRKPKSSAIGEWWTWGEGAGGIKNNYSGSGMSQWVHNDTTCWDQGHRWRTRVWRGRWHSQRTP